jgi:hypothetical protein
VFSVRSVPRDYKKDKEDRSGKSSSGLTSGQLVENCEDGNESSGAEC